MAGDFIGASTHTLQIAVLLVDLKARHRHALLYHLDKQISVAETPTLVQQETPATTIGIRSNATAWTPVDASIHRKVAIYVDLLPIVGRMPVR